MLLNQQKAPGRFLSTGRLRCWHALQRGTGQPVMTSDFCSEQVGIRSCHDSHVVFTRLAVAQAVGLYATVEGGSLGRGHRRYTVARLGARAFIIADIDIDMSISVHGSYPPVIYSLAAAVVEGDAGVGSKPVKNNPRVTSG